MSIYILCPANRVTGGIELAHQFCHAINTLTDLNAKMWYTNIDDTRAETLVVDKCAPEEYKDYHTEHISEYVGIDSEENVIVVPEGLTGWIKLFDNAQIVLWWMSVDNYVLATGEKDIDTIKEKVILHLYQSYYSKVYVNKKISNAKGMFLSDYINEEHGKFIFPQEYRRNMALYNPRKGYDEIKPLIEKANWLKWVPLIGMDREKMILVMQTSKIYVDFGNHPGKDRIPREAAANGCCVITNRRGSAAFQEDVPIPEKYKFENPKASLDDIDVLMREICNDFASHQQNFDEYRKIIKAEKSKFEEEVLRFADTAEELFFRKAVKNE